MSLFRDLGYVQPSELNTQCVHGQPDTASTVPYYTQCYYEAFVRTHIADYLNLKHTQFLLPSYLWSDVAPTWNDSVYRHHIMQVLVNTDTPQHTASSCVCIYVIDTVCILTCTMYVHVYSMICMRPVMRENLFMSDCNYMYTPVSDSVTQSGVSLHTYIHTYIHTYMYIHVYMQHNLLYTCTYASAYHIRNFICTCTCIVVYVHVQ